MQIFPTWGRRRVAALAAAAMAAAALVTAGAATTSVADTPGSQWTMFGQNLNNTAATATTISARNVATLQPKWVFTPDGDVSARAAVGQGIAYFPDWAGKLYAVKAGTGKLIWSKDIASSYLGGSAGSVVSRTSPFLDTASKTLYIGTQTGAQLLAIDATTGTLKWKTQLDTHPLAIDTQSPIVYNGSVYVGVASIEEAVAADPNYTCCSFRGSVVKLDATTGQVQWKTYTVPSGYSGGAVWGSTIVPDPARGVVYATTGNNYTVSGDSPDNHVDSVLALNMTTGAIVWADRFADADDWNVACFNSGVNCPVTRGPDFDFGSGVQLFTIQTANGPKQILGAGQKSGVYSAMNPDTGQVLWATQVGPGSALGGIEWGSATDGKRIYVAIGNLYGIPYENNPSLGAAGSFAALDAATGDILWQTKDPNGSLDLSPVAVANGVVYAASMAGGPSAPTMLALSASSGAQLWSYAAGGSTIAGASIADDTVFWGSGYDHLGIPGFTGNHKFYAFTLGGK